MMMKEVNSMIYGKRKVFSSIMRYTILILVGIIMVYPLLWMISATFKNNNDIFSGIGLIPKEFTFDGYLNAMKSYAGDIDIVKAMINTYKYVLPKVGFTVISATVTAYGFGRFNFKGRNFLFAVLMSTLFLPQVVLNVPQYILFSKFGWIDSGLYLPIIVPTMFAVDTYFVFMLIQFMRNIPKEMEEAAKIDGCNVVQILVKIIAPLLKPAIVSCALFQFMWSSNDFIGPLLYIKTPTNYPAAIFVKLSMDADTGFQWNRILAVSLISIIPSLLVFFAAQRTFVDGIQAGGIKG
jgi:oligogalacturonide transport system permease protein